MNNKDNILDYEDKDLNTTIANEKQANNDVKYKKNDTLESAYFNKNKVNGKLKHKPNFPKKKKRIKNNSTRWIRGNRKKYDCI